MLMIIPETIPKSPQFSGSVISSTFCMCHYSSSFDFKAFLVILYANLSILTSVF